MTLLQWFRNTFSCGHCFVSSNWDSLNFDIFNAMNEKINPDNDSLDPSDEYWREQNPDEEDKPYFTLEGSKPPHY